MNVETLIKEMHSDYCNGRTLAFAEKLESLLEFGDMVKSLRDWPSVTNIDGQTHVEFSVLNWPEQP